MTKHANGVRGLLAAFIVIVMTAGAAAAASGHATGLTNATEKSGKTIPVAARGQENTSEASEAPEPSESAEASESPEPSESAESNTASPSNDHCATDPRTLTAEELAALNHGAIVCWAAHQPTPVGFTNHGKWVSGWAKQNRGHGTPPNPLVPPTPH